MIYYRLGAAEAGAGRIESASEHLTKARSLVNLPQRIEAADREKIVLVTEIQEHLARVMIQRRKNRDAVSLLSEAVSAVKSGSSVPQWRVLELQRELRDAQALVDKEKI